MTGASCLLLAAMVRLSRVVRFCVNDAEAGWADGAPSGVNGYGGKPAMRGFGRYYELGVHCEGEPHGRTGYLVNIKEVDDAVRRVVVPAIEKVCRERPSAEPGLMLGALLGPLDEELDGILRGLELRLTPTYSVGMEVGDMGTVILKQRFDFAACHRLHVPELSDEENRRLFGKCNNPSGHGHNYQVEPEVAVSVSSLGEGDALPFGLAELERVTDEVLIERYDHTNLNVDTEEFGDAAGVNPSVEHIARVCFELLGPAVSEASGGRAELRNLTVWETDRTSATFGVGTGVVAGSDR